MHGGAVGRAWAVEFVPPVGGRKPRCSRQSASAGGSGPQRRSNATVDPAAAGPLMLDEEAGARPQRRLVSDGSHAMFDGDSESDGGFFGGGPDDDQPDRQDTLLSKLDIERMLEEREGARLMNEDQKKDYAKTKMLMRSRNPAELMRLAMNLIDEDWLGKVYEMPGNIYRIGAFGGLPVNSLQNLSRYFGALAIWVVQFIGPPAVFFSSLGFGVEEENTYKWDEWTNWGDDANKFDHLLADWTHFRTPKFLSILFIFLFTLNGLFVLIDEKECFHQMDNMFRYLDLHTPKFNFAREWLLYLDSFMNNWLVLWCTIDAYILVGNARSVKDVLFDSLSLLFLYNLDDISGDLGFVNTDDWDGLRLGWIYEEMVVPKFQPMDNGRFVNAEDDEIEASGLFMCMYDFTIGALSLASFALPVLAIFTPFSAIGPAD